MLKTLYIKNFALIDEIEIKFSDGLNIITGETGAGKSVIVDALMLILGDRASADFIRSGENKAVIEGKFELSRNHPVFSILHSEELDIENGELILRREISAKGNSRCFVNDTPVQLTLMKESGDQLVDFHGQHDHQLLLRRDSHCGILDAFSPIEDNLSEYRKIYDGLADKIRQFNELQRKEESLKEKKDNYIFEMNEIDKLSPKENEDAEIEKELSILENSELLSNLSRSISSMLYDNETPVRDSLILVQKSLKELSDLDNRFSVYINECESALITVNEIAKYCSNYSEGFNFDPHRIEELRLRMSQLQLLRKKYGSLSSAIERQEYLKQELELINNYDSEIETRKAEIRNLKELAGTEAEKISTIRKKSSVDFSRKIERILTELGIQNSSFSVKINRDELGNFPGGISVIIGGIEFRARNNGIDNVEFLISTNAGEEPKPLINVASGGEISRVMLALKSIAAMSESLPILVFDEIDTGVSGRIAQKVGEQMKKLAKNHQIIAITHLPQIAAAADRNIKVTKSEDEDRTRITALELKNSDKAEEVARLFSGNTITSTALKTAKDLIGYYK